MGKEKQWDFIGSELVAWIDHYAFGVVVLNRAFEIINGLVLPVL